MKSILIILMSSLIFLSCSRNINPVVESESEMITLVNSEKSIVQVDRYDGVDGFYVFYKTDIAINKPRQLIYFMHGLGALNPAIYGQWIRHLIDQSAVVVYPRYQKSVLNPLPSKFDDTMAAGIRRSWAFLKDSIPLRINFNDLHLIGHSYGGAAVNYFAINWDSLDLPHPKTAFACQPGTGPFSALSMDNYKDTPTDIKLVVLSSEDDDVVGDKLAERIFNTAIHTPNRIWIKQYKDNYGDVLLKADHRSPYSVDTFFDNDIKNGTARRAWNKSKFDAEDIQGYFKISDQLRAKESSSAKLFISSFTHWSLGKWPDGSDKTPFDIIHP